MRILTVPGYTNSGPEHWQTYWEAAHADVLRVVQRDWDRPVRSGLSRMQSGEATSADDFG